MTLKKEIRDLLDDEVRTDTEAEFDHEQGCSDCNGHDIADFYEYQERNQQARACPGARRGTRNL